MFQIRKQHLDAFHEAAVEELEDRTAADLKVRLSGVGATVPSDEKLKRCIGNSIGPVAKYGLTTEFEVGCFVEGSLSLGEGFDENPEWLPAQFVLRSHSIDSRKKAELLRAFVRTMAAAQAGLKGEKPHGK